MKARRTNSPLGPSESTETRRLHGPGVDLYGITKWNNKLSSANLALRLAGGETDRETS